MTAYQLKNQDSHPVKAVRQVFEKLLGNGADYIFVPGRSPYSSLPMPMLISDAQQVENLEPLAPVAPFNAAKQAASVLRSDTSKKIALLLKPCEKRALVELAKLAQCDLAGALIVTADCKGRMENVDYLSLIAATPDLAADIIKKDTWDDKLTSSCSVCTQFTDDDSDIHMALFGTDAPVMMAQTDKGKAALESLECETASVPDARSQEISRLTEQRQKNFDAMSESVLAKTKDVQKFQEVISNCLNCYNCRTACPVCYCKECVFLTDVFDHMPETLLNRADKKGIIKLPTDTTMFHMTRLAHMSHACVGCGHCSSVCPSSIPVADIFKVVSKSTQDFFDYIPGKDREEQIPYLNYKKGN